MRLEERRRNRGGCGHRSTIALPRGSRVGGRAVDQIRCRAMRRAPEYGPDSVELIDLISLTPALSLAGRRCFPSITLPPWRPTGAARDQRPPPAWRSRGWRRRACRRDRPSRRRRRDSSLPGTAGPGRPAVPPLGGGRQCIGHQHVGQEAALHHQLAPAGLDRDPSAPSSSRSSARASLPAAAEILGDVDDRVARRAERRRRPNAPRGRAADRCRARSVRAAAAGATARGRGRRPCTGIAASAQPLRAVALGAAQQRGGGIGSGRR